jgi:hypothetical protein
MAPNTVGMSTGFVTRAFNPQKLHDDGSPAAHYQREKTNINLVISETTFFMSLPYISICNSCFNNINLRRV